MKPMTVRDAEKLTPPLLFKKIEEAIAFVEQACDSVLDPQSRLWDYCQRALATYRAFVSGKSKTPDVKFHFAELTATVPQEVVLPTREVWLSLALAEVGHACAHMGHLSVASNLRDPAQQEYATLHRAYVGFGLIKAREFANKALGIKSKTTSSVSPVQAVYAEA